MNNLLNQIGAGGGTGALSSTTSLTPPPSQDGGAGDASANLVKEEPSTTITLQELEADAMTFKRRLPRSEVDVLAEEAGLVDVDAPTPIAAYKHRSIRHFRVGRHEFVNHILVFYDESLHDEFLGLYDGLEMRDQIAIVSYDYEAAAKVEQPVNRNVSRGALGTRDIKDAKLVQAKA